jgi:hypothetical protein
LRIKFKIILPAMYSIIAAYFAGDCILQIGHGTGCPNLYRAGIPAVFLFPKNLGLGILWAFVAGLAQYILLGFLIDKLLAPRR